MKFKLELNLYFSNWLLNKQMVKNKQININIHVQPEFRIGLKLLTQNINPF